MGERPTREDEPTLTSAPGPNAQRTARALRARLPRYEQIALALRERIEAGDLAPGDPIPSESALITEFGVSRITVRHAVAALRAAGLVVTEHGRGTRVRQQMSLAAGNSLEFDPTITRDGTQFRTWDQTGWADVEEPSRYRTEAGDHAGALEITYQEPVFVLERQMLHVSGVQIMHRTWIPFAVVDDLHLDDNPFRTPAELYSAFDTAGQPLTWTDRSRAEMPSPDDAATLDIREGVPLIVHTRITHGQDSRPLLAEETRIPADRTTLISRPAQPAGAQV